MIELSRGKERRPFRSRLTAQRARGRYLGGRVPFGWRIGDKGDLVEVPEQQEAIRRMRGLRQIGTPLRAIADEITKAGHSVSHEGVKKIISARQPGSETGGHAA